MDKNFFKVFVMISIIIANIFVTPYLIGESSTLFVTGGYLLIVFSIYAEIKLVQSFFKEKK